MKYLNANFFPLTGGMHDIALQEFGIDGNFLVVPRNMEAHAALAQDHSCLRFPVVTDPTMKAGRIELRNLRGQTLATIENLAVPIGEFQEK